MSNCYECIAVEHVGGQLTPLIPSSPSSSARVKLKQAVWRPQRKRNGKDDDDVSLRRVQSPILCGKMVLDCRISSSGIVC